MYLSQDFLLHSGIYVEEGMERLSELEMINDFKERTFFSHSWVGIHIYICSDITELKQNEISTPNKGMSTIPYQ